MGVDAVVYLRCRPDARLSDLWLPEGVISAKREDWWPLNATHEVVGLGRYYGPDYERGEWPRLAGVLLACHAHPDVDVVWYGGDAEDEIAECPVARVLEISAYWAIYGTRPYRRSSDGQADRERAAAKRAAQDPYAHRGALERLARYLGESWDIERAQWTAAPPPPLPEPPAILPLTLEVVCPICRQMTRHVVEAFDGPAPVWLACPSCAARVAWVFRRTDDGLVLGLPRPEADQ